MIWLAVVPSWNDRENIDFVSFPQDRSGLPSPSPPLPVLPHRRFRDRPETLIRSQTLIVAWPCVSPFDVVCQGIRTGVRLDVRWNGSSFTVSFVCRGGIHGVE